jgi:hypothetical protein
MNQLREYQAKLKSLNSIQWDKKQQLRKVVAGIAALQSRTHQFDFLVKSDVRYLMGMTKSISEITKDMNDRRREIRMLESYVWQIKNSVSQDAYFQDKDGTIVGVHAVGFKDGINFLQEEIWANKYVKDENGLLVMKGGSMRVHGQFEEVIEEFKKEPTLTQIEGKLKNL